MRYGILVLLSVFGCSPAPKPMVAEPKKEEKKEVFSHSFIKGYHDGYAGNWIAPARWLVVDDYRAGHAAGKRDRENKLPNRFVK